MGKRLLFGFGLETQYLKPCSIFVSNSHACDIHEYNSVQPSAYKCSVNSSEVHWKTSNIKRQRTASERKGVK